MGRAVKVFLVLSLVVSLGGFTMSILTAHEAGLSVEELAQIMKRNLKQLNVGMVMAEYSNIQESQSIEPESAITEIRVIGTFPDLVVRQGDGFAVHFYGSISNELDDLMSWKEQDGVLTIAIAKKTNANPTSAGLVAEVILPDEEFNRIKLTTVSGSVHVANIITRHLEIHSKTGGVQISSSAIEELEVETVSGDQVLLDDSTVRMNLLSQSGSIQVEAAAAAGAIETASGHVQLNLWELADHLALSTVSGNQDIFYRGGDLRYDLSTRTGWVSVFDQDQDRGVSGRIGDGSCTLSAESASGSIRFEFNQPDVSRDP